MIVVLRPVLPPPSQPLFSAPRHGDAVLLGEVIGGREAVPAAADDDHVIVGARLGRRPLLRPALCGREGLRVAMAKAEYLRMIEPRPSRGDAREFPSSLSKSRPALAHESDGGRRGGDA